MINPVNLIKLDDAKDGDGRTFHIGELPEYEQEDYDRLIYVNRNNEVSTYDNAYLNYIRTGYNYDVKNKNRNIASSILGMLTGVGGTTLDIGRNIGITSSDGSYKLTKENAEAEKRNPGLFSSYVGSSTYYQDKLRSMR